MKHWRYLLPVWFVGLGLLAGYYKAVRAAPAPSQAPTSAQQARALLAQAPRAKPRPRSAARYLGYHRYRGTVLGRPAILEINTRWVANPGYFDCESAYYYLNSGVSHPLQVVSSQQERGHRTTRPPLELTTDDQRWRATQPLGPVLTGTCFSDRGRRLGSFSLRENYAGAVRYELLEEESHEQPGVDREGRPDKSSLTFTYLHLLGPDNLRPALARWQCPTPARRRRARRALAAWFTPTRADPTLWLDKSLTITLNEAGLLAYYTLQDRALRTTTHGWVTVQNYLLDLRTGQPLHLASQLRPGAQLPLRRLLTHHARRDTAAHVLGDFLHGKGKSQLLPLPPEDFLLYPHGCTAYYGPGGSHDGNASSFEETISWAELRPLLRPGSPLLRLVRARGL